MHEEHLCVVALTSNNGARNPVLSACLLPPCCVIAYLLLFVYFQVNNEAVYLDYEDSHHHGPLLCSFQLLDWICLYCLMDVFKENLKNVCRPSEHPPVWGKKCQNV